LKSDIGRHFVMGRHWGHFVIEVIERHFVVEHHSPLKIVGCTSTANDFYFYKA